MIEIGSCISTLAIIRFEPKKGFNLVSNKLSEVSQASMTQIKDFIFQFFDKTLKLLHNFYHHAPFKKFF